MSRPLTKRTTRAARGLRHPEPASPPTRPAVAYMRVSSREQEREGYSIPAQQQLLRDYAARQGLHILQEFVEVETARKVGRTAFGELTALLAKRRDNPPVVLVEKTDRLYRNLKDWVTLDDMRIEVHLVKENAVISEGARSSEKLIHGIRVLMAKNYVENLSEEVKKGMYTKAEDGYWPSCAPIGYVNRREGGRSYIAIDPDQAVRVRELFELYDAGAHSLEGLASHAAAIGFRGRRGGRLGPAGIHMILRNPLYAGRFYWGGQIYEGRDPTIISWSLFERVQARLDGHPYTRPNEREFAFTGLLSCGHCGAAITAEIKKEKYIYYHCAKKCRKEKFVSEDALVELYLDAVRAIRLPDRIRDEIRTVLQSFGRDVEIDVSERVTAARARIERIGRLLRAAYEDKLTGQLDYATWTRMKAEWDAQRQEAVDEIDRLSRAGFKSMERAIQVFELAQAAPDLLSRRSPRDQRELLDVLLSNSVLAEGRLTVTWRKPFDQIAEWSEAAKKENADSEGQNRRHPIWSG